MDNINSSTQAEQSGAGRTWAIIAHIGGAFTNWLVPLVIYLIKKSDPGGVFDAAQAKEALNFQITVFIAYVLLTVTVIGAFLLIVPMLWSFVFSIIAAVKASNGINYRYPLTLRLIK